MKLKDDSVERYERGEISLGKMFQEQDAIMASWVFIWLVVFIVLAIGAIALFIIY